MGDNNIKIVIGGDASGLTAAAKESSEALGTFTGLTNQTSSALRKVAAESANTATALKKIPISAENLIPEGSVLEARETVKRLRKEIESLSGIQLKSNAGKFLASELQVAEVELKKLEVEAGLAKEKLEKIVPPPNAGNLFKQAYGGLRTIANILPGIGVAGIIGFATEPIINYVSALFSAKNEMAGFAKAMEDANKKAGEEIARVQILNAVITDTTRKQTDRSSAAKELSGILKDLNINLSKEAILNGQVSEATKKATEAILSRAKARAAEDRIAELSGQQLQRDIKRKAAVDNLTKATADLNEQETIRKQVIGGNSLGLSGNTIGVTQQVISLQKEIKNLDGETSKANNEIKQLLDSITSTDSNVGFKGGTEKEVDLLKQRIAALKELQGLTGLDTKQRVELAQLEIQLAKRDAVKLGFTKEEVQQQIQGILEKSFPVGTFEFDTIVTTRVNKLEPSLVKDAKALTEDFRTDIAKAVGLDKKPIEVPAPPITFTDLDKSTQAAKDALDNALKSIGQSVQTQALTSLGEAIGAALTGGDVGKVFTDFFGFLADGLKRLGEALISYGIALAGFKLAIKSLNPVVAIAAGVGAVAAGVILKASLPKFAQGGIANRATLGIFGEAGPEAIVPLSKLPDMIGKLSMNTNSNIALAPTIRISLTDLELGLERVRSSRRRLG